MSLGPLGHFNSVYFHFANASFFTDCLVPVLHDMLKARAARLIGLVCEVTKLDTECQLKGSTVTISEPYSETDGNSGF